MKNTERTEVLVTAVALAVIDRKVLLKSIGYVVFYHRIRLYITLQLYCRFPRVHYATFPLYHIGHAGFLRGFFENR